MDFVAVPRRIPFADLAPHHHPRALRARHGVVDQRGVGCVDDVDAAVPLEILRFEPVEVGAGEHDQRYQVVDECVVLTAVNDSWVE